MDLAGKRVLITGASSGIGEATAKAMARKGASVLLLARSERKLEKVAAAIAAEGGAAKVYAVDLADHSAVMDMASKIRTDLGTPDIVVNNAGAGRWTALCETAPEEARRMIEVPYLAAFHITRAFIAGMISRGSGRVVCVTSPASFLAWPNACGYIAARHAVKGFTEALRTEVHGKGVGVTLVVLGTVESPYWDHNPGSREHVPKPIPFVMPVLSSDQAAATIVKGTETNRRWIVRPRVFRLLFVLDALLPGAAM